MRLVPFELAAEEVPEHRILCVFTTACHSDTAPGGGRDRAIGRERDGGDPIALERRLGILERLLRGAELLVQNLCELSEPLTLQVGRHRHVAFGDSIDDGGDPFGTLPLQLHAEQVPVLGRPHLDGVRQVPCRITQRRKGELDGPARRDGPGGRRPEETQPDADGIAQGTVLQFDPVVRRQRVSLPRPVHRQAVGARPVLVRHPEPFQHRRVGERLRRDEHALVAHDVIQHNVRLEQVDPGLGLEQLPGADRAAIRAIPLIRLVDPDRRLRDVRCAQKPRGRHSGRRAEHGYRDDQPLEAQNRAQHPIPVEPPLLLGEAQVRAQRRRRWRNHHRRGCGRWKR